MSFLHDSVLDAALQYIVDNVTALFLCSQEPDTYTEAVATYALASKSNPTVGSPVNGASNGRRVVIAAITDGDIDTTGTASHWALVDQSGAVLLAAGEITSPVAITAGNTFTLSSFSVTIPDAV